MKTLRNTLLAAALAGLSQLALADAVKPPEFGKLTGPELSGACSRVLFHAGKMAIQASLDAEDDEEAVQFQKVGAAVVHLSAATAVHASDNKVPEARLGELRVLAMSGDGDDHFRRFEYCAEYAVETNDKLSKEQQRRAKSAAATLAAQLLADE